MLSSQLRPLHTHVFQSIHPALAFLLSLFSQDAKICLFSCSSWLIYHLLIALTFLHSLWIFLPFPFSYFSPLLPTFPKIPAFFYFSFCTSSVGNCSSSRDFHYNPNINGSQLYITSPNLSPRTLDLLIWYLPLDGTSYLTCPNLNSTPLKTCFFPFQLVILSSY